MRCSRDRSAQLRRGRLQGMLEGECAFPVLLYAKICTVNMSGNVELIGWSGDSAKSAWRAQFMFLSADYVPPSLAFRNSTFCKQSTFTWFVWFSEYPPIVPCAKKIMFFPPKPRFSETPLLFKGTQAWTVCLSAKSSSEDDGEYRALMERYWQEKTDVLWETPTPAPLCPPRISRAWRGIEPELLRWEANVPEPWHGFP